MVWWPKRDPRRAVAASALSGSTETGKNPGADRSGARATGIYGPLPRPVLRDVVRQQAPANRSLRRMADSRNIFDAGQGVT